MYEADKAPDEPRLKVFKRHLQEGRVSSAVELATRENLQAVLGYEEALREGFLEQLKKGKERQAKRLKETLGAGMDFRDQIIQGYLHRLGQGRVIDARLIQQELGEGIDFSAAPSFIQAIRDGYLNCLRMGRPNMAEELKKTMGEGIDFRSAPNYEKFVRIGFAGFLQSGKIEQARRMIDQYGEGVSFVVELRQAILRSLHSRSLSMAEKVKHQVGHGIVLNDDKLYRDGIRRHFLYYLRRGWVDDAEKIKNELSERLDLNGQVKMGIETQLKMGRQDVAEEIRRRFGVAISSEGRSDTPPPPRS